jgi:anti-sigma factor RsiW
MNCGDHSDAIADLVDQTLDPARQRALEQHAEGCAACRALIADLKSIQAAAFTLDRSDVPRHVWDRLRARLADERASSRGRRVIPWPQSGAPRAVWLAAAAALLIATTIGLLPLVRPADVHVDEAAAGADSAPEDLVASVQAELEAAEAHYDKAIQGLEQIARSESGALDPQVAAILQKNLHVIDQAIGESRAALRAQPASTDARESLFEAMRSKVALLQQTVELINEMRKGNQAEAGRLIQGLNQ